MEAEAKEEIDYDLEQYHYDLPPALIAQTASDRRARSRLLVLDRSTNSLAHHHFGDLSTYLHRGDVLVVNDTRVVPARLHGSKETGGRVELLVLDPYKDPELGYREGYHCLLKASKRTQRGSLIQLSKGIQAQVLSPAREGKAHIRFLTSRPLLDFLPEIGEVPLPPYIHRQGGQTSAADTAGYQTVYAQRPGAVAAPTAGLHFSPSLLQELEERGIEVVRITLHVGYGTFAPIRVEDIRHHTMHSEYAEIPPTSARRLQQAIREGRRIVAVGTTVVRTLEWVALQHGGIAPFAGPCTHYIYPGYRFQVVGAMITNFHLPKSTLLLLVSAFAERNAVMRAYTEAISQGYRFFSYGDAMLIL